MKNETHKTPRRSRLNTERSIDMIWWLPILFISVAGVYSIGTLVLGKIDMKEMAKVYLIILAGSVWFWADTVWWRWAYFGAPAVTPMTRLEEICKWISVGGVIIVLVLLVMELISGEISYKGIGV